MYEEIKKYLDSLFEAVSVEDAENLTAMKEELLSGLYDKYDDLLANSYTEQEAFAEIIRGEDDFKELLYSLGFIVKAENTNSNVDTEKTQENEKSSYDKWVSNLNKNEQEVKRKYTVKFTAYVNENGNERINDVVNDTVKETVKEVKNIVKDVYKQRNNIPRYRRYKLYSKIKNLLFELGFLLSIIAWIYYGNFKAFLYGMLADIILITFLELGKYLYYVLKNEE